MHVKITNKLIIILINLKMTFLVVDSDVSLGCLWSSFSASCSDVPTAPTFTAFCHLMEFLAMPWFLAIFNFFNFLFGVGRAALQLNHIVQH